MYETFAHTADLGLRVRADRLETLFAESGRGLLSVLVENPEDVRPDAEVTVSLAADDVEYQLFDWLTELLYRFETEHLLLAQFQVQLSDGAVQAVCRGESMDTTRHRMAHEVKAITYHGLRVEPTDDGWLAEVIVDI